MAKVLVLVAVTFGATAVMLRALENRLIFFPTRELLATPRELGVAYESVHLTTADSLRLHAWWIPAERERAVLLFFHGNAGNIGDRLDSIAIFHRLDLSVLIVDYRGYGQSEGEPSEQGTYLDAEAAWRYLVDGRGIAPARVIVFGRSLGAAVAAYLVATRPAEQAPAGLILESAFTSIPDMAASVFPLLPGRLLASTRYDNLERLGQVACPVLIVHSRDDEIIPFEHGRRLFDAAKEPKRFVELRHGHNDGFMLSGAIYVDGIAAFLDELP